MDLLNQIDDLKALGFDLEASVADRIVAVDDGVYKVRVKSEPLPLKTNDGKPYSKVIAGKEYAGAAFFPSGDVTGYRTMKDSTRVNYNVPVSIEILNDDATKTLQTIRAYLTSTMRNNTSLILDFMKSVNALYGATFDIPTLIRTAIAQDDAHVHGALAEAVAEFLVNNPQGVEVNAAISSKLTFTTVKEDQFGKKTYDTQPVKGASSSRAIKEQYPEAWAGKADFGDGYRVETNVREFIFREVE